MKDNTEGSFRKLLSVLELLGIQFYDVMKPAIKAVTDTLIDLVVWFNGLSEGAKTAITVIAGIAAAIGPIHVALRAVAAGIKSEITVIWGSANALKGRAHTIPHLTPPMGV